MFLTLYLINLKNGRKFFVCQNSCSSLVTHISAKSIVPDTFLTGNRQQSKHQVCTWHFNCISPLIITLALLIVQPMLFRIFTGFLSAFLTVSRQEADRQMKNFSDDFCRRFINDELLLIVFFTLIAIRDWTTAPHVINVSKLFPNVNFMAIFFLFSQKRNCTVFNF